MLKVYVFMGVCMFVPFGSRSMSLFVFFMLLGAIFTFIRHNWWNKYETARTYEYSLKQCVKQADNLLLCDAELINKSTLQVSANAAELLLYPNQ